MIDPRFPTIRDGADELPFSPWFVAALIFAGLLVAGTSAAAIMLQIRHDAGIEASQ